MHWSGLLRVIIFFFTWNIVLKSIRNNRLFIYLCKCSTHVPKGINLRPMVSDSYQKFSNPPSWIEEKERGQSYDPLPVGLLDKLLPKLCYVRAGSLICQRSGKLEIEYWYIKKTRRWCSQCVLTHYSTWEANLVLPGNTGGSDLGDHMSVVRPKYM